VVRTPGSASPSKEAGRNPPAATAVAAAAAGAAVAPAPAPAAARRPAKAAAAAAAAGAAALALAGHRPLDLDGAATQHVCHVQGGLERLVVREGDEAEAAGDALRVAHDLRGHAGQWRGGGGRRDGGRDGRQDGGWAVGVAGTGRLRVCRAGMQGQAASG
jgi:hypothetical protein